ncbi:hypothetical protein Syun_029360 [Stephania yunnanensis]|uniref:DUF4005 domain-containing protein n=1 Tax=Stephania yunnanensis TaxID=152371 RepID=A0AAP0E5H5_9MAGN
MGKASKWIRSILNGKKEKDQKEIKREEYNYNQVYSVITESPKTPMTPISSLGTPKEKRRWSFRRSKDVNTIASAQTPGLQPMLEVQYEQKRLVIMPSETEQAAAIKIQSVFRSYLARKALCALRGLVKLQALVRGYLVRKQAAETFRCMKSLLTVQARAQAQRIQAASAAPRVTTQNKQSIHRRSSKDNCKLRRYTYNEIDRRTEENIKTVEVDVGEIRGTSKSRINYVNSNQNHGERYRDLKYKAHYSGNLGRSKFLEQQFQVPPSPKAIAGMNPRAFSGYFDDYTFNVEEDSPMYYSPVSKPYLGRVPLDFPQADFADSMSHDHDDFTFFPNYMSNTKSSKAKTRSQSAPKQRPESYERQPSRRKAYADARNAPRNVQMQRSTSHVGSIANGYKFPWSIKLDRSTASLKESEYGSTSALFADANCSRPLHAYELRNY